MTHPLKLTRGVFLAVALLFAAPLSGIGPFLGATPAQAQQLISSVLFEGNQGFSDADLLLMVNVADRGTFTPASLAADAETIRLAYVGKGYRNVVVTPRTEPVDGNRSRVIFQIEEGQRTGIAAINFTGNNSIAAGTLKSVIRTRETHLLSWLFRDDSYSEDILAIDKELIRLYYANHGYPDAIVTSAVGEFDASRNAYFVSFTISEGEKYQFGTIGIETSIPGLNADALTGTIRTDQGGRYSYADLARTQEDMAFEATSQGYAFADVRPRVDRDASTNTFNITYLVDEGPRIYVERINITGNAKTRDAVIRRELDFAEGDPFNRSIVQRGKAAIERLGFFKTVAVNMQPGSAPDKVIVDIVVEEQSTGDYGLTAGYSSDGGVMGELSLTERNFLGRGQYVRASIGASMTGQSYEFSFTEPRFMGLRISSGFDVYHRIVDETDANIYGSTSTGGQLRFGLPVTRDLTATLFMGLEQKVFQDDAATFSHIVTDDEVKNKAWIGYNLVYNGLDDTKHPTEGLYATLSQSYIGWDHNLLKTEVKGRYFIPIMDDAGIVGSVRGQAGVINSFSGGVHPSEAFRLGPTLVRGFTGAGMGPKEVDTSETLGFTMYAGGSAEVQFPIPVLPESYGLSGAVWADAAWISGEGASAHGSAGTSTDNPLKASVGASVIWDGPFGPLRGDFAHVISKATDDDTQIFQLTIQQLL